MAVHVPLSTEAKLEARMQMLTENNSLTPANGFPIATPSQDMVLGCFYLTKMVHGRKGEGMLFASPEEVMTAYQMGIVNLQAEIKVRQDGRVLTTTPGRMILASGRTRIP